jgi:hypothetical protein
MLTLLNAVGTLPVALAMWGMIVLAGACLVKAVTELRKL